MLYVERQAQAHGISAIFPLLEPRLVDTMLSYPYKEVFANGWQFMMKKSAASWMPAGSTLNGPKKGSCNSWSTVSGCWWPLRIGRASTHPESATTTPTPLALQKN